MKSIKNYVAAAALAFASYTAVYAQEQSAFDMARKINERNKNITAQISADQIVKLRTIDSLTQEYNLKIHDARTYFAQSLSDRFLSIEEKDTSKSKYNAAKNIDDKIAQLGGGHILDGEDKEICDALNSEYISSIHTFLDYKNFPCKIEHIDNHDTSPIRIIAGFATVLTTIGLIITYAYRRNKHSNQKGIK